MGLLPVEAGRIDTAARSSVYGPEHFARDDDPEDSRFYTRDRFVNHMDSELLATVEKVVETLGVDRRPAVLDLMAGWNAHIPITACASSRSSTVSRPRMLAPWKAVPCFDRKEDDDAFP